MIHLGFLFSYTWHYIKYCSLFILNFWMNIIWFFTSKKFNQRIVKTSMHGLTTYIIVQFNFGTIKNYFLWRPYICIMKFTLPYVCVISCFQFMSLVWFYASPIHYMCIVIIEIMNNFFLIKLIFISYVYSCIYATWNGHFWRYVQYQRKGHTIIIFG